MNLSTPGRAVQLAAIGAPTGLDDPLFARYVKALALLCECHPYVDEPHFEEMITELLRDAASSYPIHIRYLAGRYELALLAEPGPTKD